MTCSWGRVTVQGGAVAVVSAQLRWYWRGGGGFEGGDLGEECPEDEEEGLWGCGRCFGDDWRSLL